MGINFPGNCTTPREHMAWCERAFKLLLLVHNGMGEWRKTGISNTAWDKFPVGIKNNFPYKAQITKAEFKNFFVNYYKPKEEAIHEARNEAKESFKQLARASTKYSPDLDGDIT